MINGKPNEFIYLWVWRDGTPAIAKGRIVGALKSPMGNVLYQIELPDFSIEWRYAVDLYYTLQDVIADVPNLVL